MVFILDNNYKIAQDVAVIHNYKQIYDTLENTYNVLLHSKEFDLKKSFRTTIKDVKIRREKFQKLAKKTFEKAINEYDYTTTVNKKSDEISLLDDDINTRNGKIKLKQSFIGRLMVVPK